MFHFLKKLKRAFRKLGRRLAGLGAALVWPIERPFRAFGRALIACSARFENWLGSLGGALAWPFRALGRGLGKLTSLLLPDSLRARLAARFRRWRRKSRRLGRRILRAAEAVNLDRPVLWLVWLLQPVWRPLAALGGFFHAWVETRNYKQMLWGLPALVMLLPFVLVLVKTVVFGNASVAGQYRLAVKEALEAKDYERAHLYERKLAQLGVDTQLTDYRTAETLARDGKLGQAVERMQRLAPEDQPGYPSAHYWLAQTLLIDKLEIEPEEAMRLAGVHLEHLQTLGYQDLHIQLLRAYWLIRSKRFAEAAEVLQPLTVQLFEGAVQRLQIDLTLKRPDQARSDARQVRRHLQDRQRHQRSITSKDYRWWAVAEDVLGERGQLEHIVRTWLELDPDNAEANQLLASILRNQFVEGLQALRPNPKRLANLLLETAKLSDDNLALRKLVDALYQRQSDWPMLRRVADQLAREPHAPAVLCEVLGSAAARSGQLEQARLLLQQAVSRTPDRAVAWNNLAWVLYHDSPADLAAALTAVNRALELTPDEFRFRETRGQIFVSLKRWQEAIPDLEYAVNGMPENKEIHQSLAKAYAALGEDELALVHRQQGE